MSRELIAIIEQIEREKGIKKDVLVKAVESALLSAVKRVIDAKPNENLDVKLDPETGDIKAFRNNEEITNVDFGRIAASAARQVIIQKIREAEKDVVFGEFQGKTGEIVSGTVYRFEKGNIIIDLLGKAEGLLPKSEQIPKEETRQGQRLRAMILEVKKDNRGPQIILTRKHQNLVKKLFELEVPEIYEGIVEIRSISRQAGERTKIAVWSKDEKVDSVGACVGMRGGRVKNIVNELSGEKIDIVRYHDDIREYIKASLLPAEVSEIRLNKDAKRAEVIVADDQLSLAIGKHGQNVRLASKLVGWELDVRTRAMAEAAAQDAAKQAAAATGEAGAEGQAQPQEAAAGAPAQEAAGKPKAKRAKKPKAKKEKPAPQEAAEEGTEAQKAPGIADLDGIGEKTLGALNGAGFNTVRDIAAADVEALVKVKGIAKAKAQKLIAQAKKLSGA
ncbi:MAG: transcription termination factor NusA [Candidatus Omnitrophica bacterium]|nr:transcription termination factor NusA [Candidatus Omnitrophota bacterium]